MTPEAAAETNESSLTSVSQTTIGSAANQVLAAHVPNLFDRSRFQGKVTFVESVDQARELSPDLLFVDLDRCDDTEGFCIEGATVIGFGPHVDTALHQRAADCGYTEVLPRSVFFKRLPELLGSAE